MLGLAVLILSLYNSWRFQSERYLTLKIGNCNFQDPKAASHEARLEDHIARANPSHAGRNYLRTFVERFEESSSNGAHVCLAYEPMREPLWLFQNRCRDQKLPLGLLKGYLKLLLEGLDYLHSECKIIHTGMSSTLHHGFGPRCVYVLMVPRSQGRQHPSRI